MRLLAILLVLPLASCSSAGAPSNPPKQILSVVAPTDRFVVLPSSQATVMAKQCSRAAPNVEGGWDVPADVIAVLEKNLHKISDQSTTECCLVNSKIENPDLYYRQYVGVVVGGKRYVYINALKDTMGDDWRAEPMSPCDGGDYFWGALFDPITGEFSMLAINGAF